ncbi:TVP38/TMEM64 family protein [Haloarchaeobius amylolyticus]|uniref:TVP38/TMEM64 family protein n=1 Tax=Haloarchaeobius amylolyticus TaxID=1198296 RepID=UPI0022716784|nr:VTT domain-containing protein [Haloarchaeobius amylolyticus]
MLGDWLPDGPVFTSRANRRKALLSAVVLVGGTVLAAWLVVQVEPRVTDQSWLAAQFARFDRLAPVVFVAIQTVQVILAPIPGQTLGGVGGFLFGWVAGTAYSILGVAIGSHVVFLFARAYGRPAVEDWVTADVLDGFDDFVDDHGELGLFLAFLFPAFPDDALCFIAGLSPVSGRRFLLLVVVGRLPSFLAVAYAGDSLATGDPWEFAAIVAVLGVGSLVAYLRRDALVGLVGRVSDT